MLMFFHILKIYTFFGIFWITWKYVSHDTSGRTNTRKERRLFL